MKDKPWAGLKGVNMESSGEPCRIEECPYAAVYTVSFYGPFAKPWRDPQPEPLRVDHYCYVHYLDHDVPTLDELTRSQKEEK